MKTNCHGKINQRTADHGLSCLQHVYKRGNISFHHVKMKKTSVKSCVLVLLYISTLLFVDGMVPLYEPPTKVIHNYSATMITEGRDV